MLGLLALVVGFLLALYLLPIVLAPVIAFGVALFSFFKGFFGALIKPFFKKSN
ncbi:hypothetical protein [Moraxella marmotae]|uniref:hypothetical protein n=1 Tax=Moraxella marmotae TaxID=3344520 RepID=UPI0035D47624